MYVEFNTLDYVKMVFVVKKECKSRMNRETECEFSFSMHLYQNLPTLFHMNSTKSSKAFETTRDLQVFIESMKKNTIDACLK